MSKMSPEEFGNRFRELRKILHKTQVEMSEELEITQANMSQIESGKCLPNFSFQQRLAERFPEVNFNWILYGEESPIRKDSAAKIKNETEVQLKRKLEKSYFEKLNELSRQLEQLKEDNSKLIQVLMKKKEDNSKLIDVIAKKKK